MATRRDPPVPIDREGAGIDGDEPEPTARPSGGEARELAEEEDERVVPIENVGGAAPTALGQDSGGDLPGPADDLASLPEPEPPEPPEVGAVHVRGGRSRGR